jgi:hypothetical protein
MPPHDQLEDAIDTVAEQAERLWDFTGLTGEALVVGRQFAELAFLLLDRLPSGGARVSAVQGLKVARDRALDALAP